MIEIGKRRQLFLDDYIIAEKRGLTRKLHQPERVTNNPVIAPEYPWEDRGTTYPVVFQDNGKFKMYYISLGSLKHRPLGIGNFVPVGYAESADGIHWTKPLMPFQSLPGYKKTNLAFALREPPLLQMEGPCVVLDDNASAPNRKYKMFFSKGRDRVSAGEGFSVAFSPDGFQWKQYPGNPVNRIYGDTQNCVLWDPEIERWLAFVRLWGRPNFDRPVWHYQKYDEWRIRKVGLMTSADFEHWTRPEVVHEPIPSYDHRCDFYGLQVTCYEGILIGFLWVLRIFDDDPGGQHGHGRPQLVISRDHGQTWLPVADHEHFLERESEDAFDSGQRFPVPFITRQDRHFVYYSCAKGYHGEKNRNFSIALATLRRDGFVSLDPEHEQGALITHPIAIEGTRLHLNAEIRQGGQIVVQIQEPTGTKIAESEPIGEGQTDIRVPFASETLAPFKRSRLSVALSNASLYSFWIE